MKNINILMLLAVVLLAACNDDFLEKSPKSSLAKENFFNTESDLNLYINGLHSVAGTGLFLSDQGTDNMATTAAVEIKNIITGSPNANNITGGWSWGRLRSINFFLSNYERADIEENTKKHYAGVAKFYRAEFYFSKVKRYSDVPWYSKELSTDDPELFKPRDSRTLVVDSIMADIAYAATHIREQVPSGAISRWAALLLQARIALYEGTYRKYHPELGLETTAEKYLQIARDAAKELMDSGEFAIHNTGSPATDYMDLFVSDDLISNPESILVNVYDVSKDKSGGNGTVFGNYEQSPSKSMMNSYLMTDGTRYTSKTGHETETFVEEFENRDPRMSQTFAYPGWIREPANLYVQELNKNFTGYHQLKGYNNSTEPTGADIAVYRYAEALLIYAEARAELGELTQADLDATINRLRDRVDMPHLSMDAANADPDPVMEARFTNVAGANKGVILEIRRERRVEFAVEAKRFDDLMRWHAGKLLEQAPKGMYFGGLGKYDMTGDGVEDIILIDSSEDIPGTKEKNSLGVQLIYYKTGAIGDDRATVYLENGDSGNIVTSTATRTFEEPKYYYRPIPAHQVSLNPNLKQIMGW